MKLESLGLCLLVACTAAGCGEEARAPGAEVVAPAVVRVTRQEGKSDYYKVLILGISVTGGLSSPSARPDLALPAQCADHRGDRRRNGRP